MNSSPLEYIHHLICTTRLQHIKYLEKSMLFNVKKIDMLIYDQ